MKKIDFFSLYHPPAIHECPHKNLAQLVLPFGRLNATYIWMSGLPLWPRSSISLDLSTSIREANHKLKFLNPYFYVNLFI